MLLGGRSAADCANQWRGLWAFHRALIYHLLIRNSRRNRCGGYFMVRWRKRSQLQAYLTATSPGLEPRQPHQLARNVSTFIRWPGFRTKASTWANPEVRHCANAVAALPILRVLSPTRAKSTKIHGRLSRVPIQLSCSFLLMFLRNLTKSLRKRRRTRVVYLHARLDLPKMWEFAKEMIYLGYMLRTLSLFMFKY